MASKLRLLYVALAYPLRLVLNRPPKAKVGFDRASHQQLHDALQNTHLQQHSSRTEQRQNGASARR
jgi:hypothetical protein